MFSSAASLSASIAIGIQLTAGYPSTWDTPHPEWATTTSVRERLLDLMISVSTPPPYHLSTAEQRALKRALLRSFKLVS
jgi:hypothetical protein